MKISNIKNDLLKKFRDSNSLLLPNRFTKLSICRIL